MKWRLTFSEPGVPEHKRNVFNSVRVEVPAQTESGPVSIESAAALGKAKDSTRHVGWVLVAAALVPDDDHVTDWLVPHPVARLAFDPTRIEDRMLRRVWKDPLARTIWLAVRYRHLVNQYFTGECLNAAREIRRLRPTDVPQLERAMRHGMPSHACGITEPFWSQFLPYVLGHKQLGYLTTAA